MKLKPSFINVETYDDNNGLCKIALKVVCKLFIQLVPSLWTCRSCNITLKIFPGKFNNYKSICEVKLKAGRNCCLRSIQKHCQNETNSCIVYCIWDENIFTQDWIQCTLSSVYQRKFICMDYIWYHVFCMGEWARFVEGIKHHCFVVPSWSKHKDYIQTSWYHLIKGNMKSGKISKFLCLRKLGLHNLALQIEATIIRLQLKYSISF